MLAVGHFGCEFDTPIDRAGGENEHVGFRSPQAITVHAEQVGVFANRGKERAALPLELNAEQVDAIDLAEDGVEIVRDLDTQFGDVFGNEGGRAADDDTRTQFGQPPDVRPGDAAVSDVADEGDGLSFQRPAPFADGEDVEQCLRGMFVGAVARVEHADVQMFRQQMRCTGCAMSHDNLRDAHRLDVASRIDKRLAFHQAAAGRGEVDGVGTEPFGSQTETGAGSRGRLEEQVGDDRAGECGEFVFAFGCQTFELGRLVENQRNFACT